MTKPQRKIILVILVVTFFLSVPVLILYSQGYRFDWETKRLTQTGALFLKVFPARADIFLDNKFIKKTDFFFDSALIKDLLPKKYNVRVEKEGYTTWVKNLEVKPATVTEAKHIILFPKELKFFTLFENILNFWPSPNLNNLKDMVLQKKTENQGWKLIHWNPDTKEEKILLEGDADSQIWKLDWSQDSKKILIQLAKKEQMKILIFHLKENRGRPCTEKPCQVNLGLEKGEIVFGREENELIFTKVINENSLGLFRTNYLKQEPPSSLGTRVITFKVDQNAIIFLDEDGTVWEKDIASDSLPKTLNSQPYPVKKETRYKLFKIGDIFFLLAGEELFEFNRTGQIKKITDSLKIVEEDIKGDNLALAKKFEIWIYNVKNKNLQPLYFAKEPIGNITWLDRQHLIFVSGNKIKIGEIDTRDKPNIIELGVFSSPKFIWRPEDTTLYVLDKNRLLVSEKLIR